MATLRGVIRCIACRPHPFQIMHLLCEEFLAQYPSLPLFTDAYLADTKHLTPAQHGAYLLLLMMAWRMPDCKLQDDDKFLARCVGMDLRTWKKNREVVMAFWQKDDKQKWYQPRLLDERKYVADKSSKNSHNAKARWLNYNNTGHANALPEPCETDAPTPTSTPISIDKDKRSSYNEKNKNVDKYRGNPAIIPPTKENYNVDNFLTDVDRMCVQSESIDWDYNALVITFNTWVKKHDIPKNPSAAFLAWVISFTKGKPPC